MSTRIDLGPVLPIFKGDWVSGTAYERLNIVRHNSAAWVCNIDLIPNDDVELPPSRDNSNWVILAIDTSAVSSVNGQTGDIIINTVDTPSDDSNILSITNIEWVRDKINEAIESVSNDTTTSLAAITEALNNKVSKDGDEMTGDLISTAFTQQLADIDTTATPEQSIYDRPIRFVDKNGQLFAMLQPVQWNNGGNALRLIVAKKDGTQGVPITIEQKPDGTMAFTSNGKSVVTSVNSKDAAADGSVRTWAINKGAVDPDTLIEAGTYFVQHSDTGTLPSGINGFITVECIDTNSTIRQVFYRTGTVGSNDHNIYTRTRNAAGTWGAWNKIFTEKDGKLTFHNGTQFWIA